VTVILGIAAMLAAGLLIGVTTCQQHAFRSKPTGRGAAEST